MHPALLTLIWLRGRGFFRRLLRNLRTPRHALFLLAGLLIFVPSLAMPFLPGMGKSEPQLETVRAIIPLTLLGICLLTLLGIGSEQAIQFRPAEVDLLFSGPFARRELLAYKLALGALGQFFTALFLTVMLWRHLRLWWAGFAGTLMAFFFTYLLQVAYALINQTVVERAYTRTRKIILGLILSLLAVAAWQTASIGIHQSGPLEWLRQMRESWACYALLAPFEVFAQVITAEAWYPTVLIWGGLALVMDLALLFAVIRLDANYLEVSLHVSQKLYERWQRNRRGFGTVTRGAAKRTVPMLPRLAGAGTIAWRHLTALARKANGLFLALLIVGLSMIPAFLIKSDHAGPPLAIALFITVFSFPLLFAFDFRADLDHLDWLKTLPIRGAAIVVGEVVTPILVTTTAHLLLLAGMAVFIYGPRQELWLSALLAVPFNFLLFGLENLIFLLFPTRMVANAPGDFHQMGRLMIILCGKFALLAVIGSLAVGVGGIAFFLTGHSQAAFWLVLWLALAAFGVALVPLMVWAFHRFDPSRDVPP